MSDEYLCNKCNYEWFSKLDIKPKQCPRCKRYDWDKTKGERPGAKTAGHSLSQNSEVKE